MIKPFSLHAVLRYRKQREERAAARLAQALQQLQRSQKRLTQAKGELLDLSQATTRIQQEGIDIDVLIRHQHRLEFLQKKVDEMHLETEKKRKDVTTARDEAVARSKERKIMEQFKDKKDREYKLYLEKRETLQLDEIAVLSHDRKDSSDK